VTSKGAGLALFVLAACHHPHGTPPSSDAPPDSIADASTDAGVGGCSTGVNGPATSAQFEGWCWVYPLPQGHALVSVWAAAADDVWVFTGEGTLLHSNGTTWTQFGQYAQYGPSSTLWGTASNDVWAATSLGGIQHWDGTAWTQSYATNQGASTGPIGATSASDVWVANLSGTVGTHMLEWNGSQWLPHPDPGFQPLAIGGSPGTVLAVSSAGAIAQWLGNAWGISDAGTHAANAAVVIDATHLVVAQNGSVSFWDSGTWTTRATPVAANWSAIAASSLSDVWVAGGSQGDSSLRYHWDGSSWTAADDLGAGGAMDATAGAGAAIRPFSEDASGAVYVALDDATVRRWNGSAWTSLTTGTNYVNAVWGTAANDIWILAGAQSGTNFLNHVLHWDGTAWTEPTFPFTNGNNGLNSYVLRGIWGSAPNDYWIAAGYIAAFNITGAQRFLLHWDGSSWSQLGPYGADDAVSFPYGFTRIWGSGADDVYAVARTAVYHRDASGWSPIAALPGGTDVIGTGPNDVYVLSGTTLWHWDGTTWSSKTAPISLGRGWMNSPTDIWLANGRELVHYDGTFFVNLTTTSIYVDSPVGSANEMFTFGGGIMTRWIGGYAGTSNDLQLFFDPNGNGWVAPDGHVWAAGTQSYGNGGLLVH
jgi:hypothetical protein